MPCTQPSTRAATALTYGRLTEPYPRPMDTVAGWSSLLAAAALLLLAAFPLRTRLPHRVLDGLLALGGAGIGAGGLLLLSDVEPASWVVAPVLLAVAAVAHVRFLWAGEGPFRT
jgi:hypothetical protein